MKSNKIILALIILSMVALIFSGCGGGNPVTPPIEDEEQEYVVEEKSFNVEADQGGTFSLSDGTELKIDPGALSDDAYVVLKRVRYDDLDFSKTWWADENPFVWIVDIFDCDDILGNVELYMMPSQLEYIGGEISGGVVKLKDGAFELVNEFTATVGEKVLVSIEEIGKTAYLFVTNPINDVMIMNDLVVDINSAVKFYYDGNCTSLFSLYQQAQQEEENTWDDLENYPGVTREDAEEIFAKLNSWETIIDLGAELITGLAPNPVTAAYSIYSAVVGIGEICKYTNAYMIAKNKSDIYSSKIFKRRVINYLYKQGCIGENHPPVISSLTANPSSVDIRQTTTITCSASDPDGDSLTYDWTVNAGSFEGSTSGSSVIWRAPSAADIYIVVSCEVSDGEGGEDSESINIIVTESDEIKIENAINGFVQAFNDKDWDKVRSYCVYGSVVYNEMNELEQHYYDDPSSVADHTVIHYISPININGQYAEAYAYFTTVFIYNGEVVEYTGEQWHYLQKIADDWKIYDYSDEQKNNLIEFKNIFMVHLKG